MYNLSCTVLHTCMAGVRQRTEAARVAAAPLPLVNSGRGSTNVRTVNRTWPEMGRRLQGWGWVCASEVSGSLGHGGEDRRGERGQGKGAAGVAA